MTEQFYYVKIPLGRKISPCKFFPFLPKQRKVTLRELGFDSFTALSQPTFITCQDNGIVIVCETKGKLR